MIKRLVEMVAKYAMDIRIRRIEREIERKKSMHARIVKVQEQNMRKLSRQLNEELKRSSKLSNEEYRRLADSIYLKQSRRAYSDFIKSIKLEQQRLKNKEFELDAKETEDN